LLDDKFQPTKTYFKSNPQLLESAFLSAHLRLISYFVMTAMRVADRVTLYLHQENLWMKQTFVLLLFCGLAGAQSKPLANKPWDIGIWVGGGTSVSGGVTDTQAVNAAVRLGKVLTGDHFGGFLRGNFEWSADLLPIYYVVQPLNNAYGAGFNPLNLKWNFTSANRAV